MEEKLCSTCKTKKSLDDFTRRKGSKDGRTSECRVCRAEFRRNNKPKINETRRKYYKSTLQYDTKFLNMRRNCTRAYNIIKNISESRYDLYDANVGCTQIELANHLQETAIANGYSDFDIFNYDRKDYHIDHIRPLKLYLDGIEELDVLLHYTNTQILTGSSNMLKGESYEEN